MTFGRFLVRHFRWVAGVTFVAFLANVYFVTFGFGGDRHTQGNIAQAIAPIWAALVCWICADLHPRRLRLAWRLLSLSAASWGLGQITWCYYELISGRETPFPSFADLGYLTAVPLGVAALILFIDTPSGRVAWLRAALEAAITAIATLFLSWAMVLGPVYRAGGDNLFAQAISLAYPLGDVIILTLVLYAASRANRQLRSSLMYVGAAMASLAFADSGFAYLTVHEVYETGSPVDLGWFGGYALLGLAALRVKPESVLQATENTGRIARVTSFAPFFPFAVALMLVLTRAADPRHDSMLWWTGVLAVTLIGVLQLAALADNARLNAHLEARVNERTRNLQSRERFFRSIVQNSSDVVSVVNDDLRIVYQTPSAATVLGHDPQELVGVSIFDLFDENEREHLESAIDTARRDPGAISTIEASVSLGRHLRQRMEVTIVSLLDDPDVQGIVINTTDITERKALEQQLTHQAFHDRLTTLPNRALFHDRLTHALERARRDISSPLAVLFIDLDGFKSINDSLGHVAGDHVLHEFAERTRAMLRPSDTFARIGGDEFAVLIEEPEDAREASRVADRILRELLTPFVVEGRDIFVNASIGIATSDTARTPEELQRNADVAMYNAKAAGRGGFRMYETQMHDKAMARLELESGVRRALENEEFAVHYQPIVRLDTEAIIGFEALVRWNHPDRGIVGPDKFIPVAEETGLILPMGRWVLRRACEDAVAWRKQFGNAAPKVSVNLSQRQLQQDAFVDELAQILFETGLPPWMLTLELTESMLADDPTKAAQRLRTIKELGVTLAIDDFGTGYSSLSYLQQFPFDILKIDRRFVSAITTNSDDAALVEAIVDLGKLFRLHTVAEGIETTDQGDKLRQLGCEFGQGYHFARPVPVEQTADLIASMSVQPS
jgi:diguanylate cyclase (GGDEF)-like protein/PAS domain S-box-containing protein